MQTRAFRLKGFELGMGAQRYATFGDAEPLPEGLWRPSGLFGKGGNTGWVGEAALQRALFYAGNHHILKVLASAAPDAEVELAARELGGSGGFDVAAILRQGAQRTMLLVGLKPSHEPGFRETIVQGIRIAIDAVSNLAGPLAARPQAVLLSPAASSRRLPANPAPRWRLGPKERWRGLDGFSLWSYAVVARSSGEDRRAEHWLVIAPSGEVRLSALEYSGFDAAMADPVEGLDVTVKGKSVLPYAAPRTAHGKDAVERIRGNIELRYSLFADFARATLRVGADGWKGAFTDPDAPLSRLRRQLYEDASESTAGWTFLGETNDKGNVRLVWERTGTALPVDLQDLAACAKALAAELNSMLE